MRNTYGRPTEGSTTYRQTAGLPGQSDEDGAYVRKLLNMDPEEFWLRQGWMQAPDGQWYRDTGMRDHIASVGAQERKPWGGMLLNAPEAADYLAKVWGGRQ